jgi:hypothetical protein
MCLLRGLWRKCSDRASAAIRSYEEAPRGSTPQPIRAVQRGAGLLQPSAVAKPKSMPKEAGIAAVTLWGDGQGRGYTALMSLMVKFARSQEALPNGHQCYRDLVMEPAGPALGVDPCELIRLKRRKQARS